MRTTVTKMIKEAEIVIEALASVGIHGYRQQTVVCALRQLGPSTAGELKARFPSAIAISYLQLHQLKKKKLIRPYYEPGINAWPKYALSKKVIEAFDRAEQKLKSDDSQS